MNITIIHHRVINSHFPDNPMTLKTLATVSEGAFTDTETLWNEIELNYDIDRSEVLFLFYGWVEDLR